MRQREEIQEMLRQDGLRTARMTLVLDAVYVLLALLASPYILFRMARSRRWRAGLAQRLGAIPLRSGDKPCIWIHAVSVGELSASRTLIDLILKEHPEWDLRISTTTNTGQKLALEQYGAERCFFFPLDLSWAVRRAFRRVRPDVIVLVELEVWPNFVRVGRARGVTVAIMNGRMREKWVGVYRKLGFLLRPLLDPAGPNLFCVQNEIYRDRFVRAGFPAEKVRVTGTMKYDSVRMEVDPSKLESIRAALGLKAGERVWIASCTWPGEEEICLRVHKRLQQEVPALRLIIAPRHIERADDVARQIAQAGYKVRRRSAGTGPDGPAAVALLDSVGELGYLYAIVEFVFMGKSLTARGGHNVLDPAALGVVPVFGPLTDNFQEEAQLLLDAGAAERVADETELAETLLRLLREPEARQERALKGRAAVLKRQGASRRHLEILSQALASGRSDPRRTEAARGK
jgi:3-deoxy-D-manno-octulosonic-acid transferase